MGRRFIDLKTISGKGIKSFTFLKSSLYATVSLAGSGSLLDQKQKKQRTPADRTGGENPEWDHPIRIVLESQDQGLVLQFDIVAHAFLGDRLVGRVRVPVADLSPENPAGAFRTASYLVQTSNGKPNGVLSFLYEMNGGKGRILPPASAASNSPPKTEFCPPSASSSGYYPPPPTPALVGYPPEPDPAIYYPPPDPQIYYPPPDPAIYYPKPPADPGYFLRPYPANGYPTAPVSGYYPPVPPVHVACYPSQEPYVYPMDDHHQAMYRCY